MTLFQVEDDIFPKDAFGPLKTKMTPAKFWKWVRIVHPNVPEPIQALLLKFEIVHQCSASSAAVERDFSLYGRIHNKVRNRLTTKRVAKMVKVVRLLKSADEDNGDDDCFYDLSC